MYRAPIGANVKRSLEMQNPPQIVATRADKELKKRCFLTTHLSVEEPGFVPYFRFFQVVEALDTVGLAYTPKVDKKIALGLVFRNFGLLRHLLLGSR